MSYNSRLLRFQSSVVVLKLCGLATLLLLSPTRSQRTVCNVKFHTAHDEMSRLLKLF